MNAAQEADAKTGEDRRVDPASVKALKSVLEGLKRDPAAIHAPELSFFKGFLKSWGAKLPAEDEKQQRASAPEEEESKPQKSREPEPEAAAGPQEEEDDEEEEEPEEPEEEDPERLPDEDLEPLPELGPAGEAELTDEQLDAQCALKQAAVEAVEDGDLKKAVQKYSEAIKIGNATAMMYAKRAEVLLKLQRPNACIADCNAAIGVNPDSGKAYRIRGKAHRRLGHWEEAHADLCMGQRLDFDDATVDVEKFVAERWRKIHERQTRKRIREEERARKKKEAEIRRRKEAAKKAHAEAKKSAPQSADPFDDPELMAGFQNPRVQAAAQEIMNDPSKLSNYVNDPEVMKVFNKLSQMGGQGGPMGSSMGGGMGGMGGFGGMGGACGGGGGPCTTPGPKVEEVPEDDANELD